jgi:hypothetical protein
MEFNISTKSYIFSFRNIYYDDEAGLIKTLLNNNDSKNSIVFDIVDMKTFLEESMNDKYFTPIYKLKEVTLDLIENLEFYLFGFSSNIKNFKTVNLICLVNKISNMIIHHNSNPILNDIKNKIINKFIALKAIDFNINDSLLIEKVYKNLWFLFNHFIEFKINKNNEIVNKINFTIYDYIFDNLN